MVKSYRLVVCLLWLFSINSFAQDFSIDKKIGAESAVQVEQMMGIYYDSALTGYVNAVGQRLVNTLGEAPVTFQFHVVDMAEPNAFALPGGYIYVSRGLLSLVNDEAEVACVIGHEMIHVTKRHSVKQMKNSIIPGLLQIPGAVVGMFNSDLGRIINTPVSLGSELFLSNYSRRQEREADRLGIKLASRAGYDPGKLAVILKSMSEYIELLSGEEEKRNYFSSHPFTPKRVEKIEKEIPELQWMEKIAIAADKISLYGKLNGMVSGQNPAHGIFEEGIFKHPDLNLAITFPEEWNTMNVPVAVGATQPDGEAQLVLMVDNSGSDPDSLGKALTAQLQNEYNIKPDQSKSLTINGFPAYVVSIVDKSGKEPVEMQVYWLKTENFLFNINGMNLLKHSESIANAVNSIRPLTDEERLNISGLKIRVATANENETVEAFSKRTNNSWDKETTIIKNGLETNAVLIEGQVLKIALEELFID